MLMAVCAETTSAIWAQYKSEVVIDKDEKGGSKDSETEKEDSKDKLFTSIFYAANTKSLQTLFILTNIRFTYDTHLSLPEIPPELS